MSLLYSCLLNSGKKNNVYVSFSFYNSSTSNFFFPQPQSLLHGCYCLPFFFFPQFENYVASLVALVITYRSNMELRVLIIMRQPAGVVDFALCFHPVHPYSNVVGVEPLQIKTKRNATKSASGGEYCVIDAFFLLSSYLCCL